MKCSDLREMMLIKGYYCSAFTFYTKIAMDWVKRFLRNTVTHPIGLNVQ